MKPRTPKRGDVVLLEFNSFVGHEQKGYRPAVVISHGNFNAKSGLAIVCPITKQKKGYPFEVGVNSKEIEGVVLADQIKSIDWKARKAKIIGEVDEYTITETIRKANLIFN